MEDADGIKVLAQNVNTHLFVNNCYFKNCSKRAMKFQSRDCHSQNNYIYYDVATQYPIDFQRGYGSSLNDTIELVYKGDYDVTASNIAYCGVSIAQGNVTIDNLKVICNINCQIQQEPSLSRLIYLNKYDDVGINDLKNIKISNVVADGFNMVLYVDPEVSSIDNLVIENLKFNSRYSQPLLNLNNINISNSLLSNIIITGNINTLFSGSNNLSNSFINLNISNPRLLPNNFNNIVNNFNNDFNTSNFLIRNKMIVFNKDNSNPSNNPGSSFSGLRNAPIGTIVLNNEPVLSDNFYIIGYISTTTGSNSNAGEFIPLKIPV